MTDFPRFDGFDPCKPLHAYLILTPGLLAARSAAQALCLALMCERLSDTAQPCMNCRACRKILAGTHPDVMRLGQGKVSVEDVRDLRAQAYLAPNESERKVFILESVENFNVQSQNALLKVLEEPPQHVVFLLTALSKSGVLPTVLSRVCVLSPSAQGTDSPQIAARLLGASASEEQKAHLALYLELYEDTDADTLSPELIESVYALAYNFYKGIQTEIVPLLPKKREDAQITFRVFMLLARSVAVYKLTGGAGQSLPDGEDFRKICARLSAKRAAAYYELFEKAYLLTEDYANTNALYAYLTEQL